jgi:hypothetical protein
MENIVLWGFSGQVLADFPDFGAFTTPVSSKTNNYLAFSW